MDALAVGDEAAVGEALSAGPPEAWSQPSKRKPPTKMESSDFMVIIQSTTGVPQQSFRAFDLRQRSSDVFARREEQRGFQLLGALYGNASENNLSVDVLEKDKLGTGCQVNPRSLL